MLLTVFTDLSFHDDSLLMPSFPNSLQHVDLCSIADVSKIHVDSILRTEVSRVSDCSGICILVGFGQIDSRGEMRRLVPSPG
jgi:hypothetical protein